MTKRQIINNLRKCGWRPSSIQRHKDVWLPPIAARFDKNTRQGVSMMRAAELCGLGPWLAAANLNKADTNTAETSTWKAERDRDLEHESRVDYDSEHNPTHEE